MNQIYQLYQISWSHYFHSLPIYSEGSETSDSSGNFKAKYVMPSMILSWTSWWRAVGGRNSVLSSFSEPVKGLL